MIESRFFCLKCGSHPDSGRVEDNCGRCPDCASERLVRWPTRRSPARKPPAASPTPATAAGRVHSGLLVSTLLVATSLGLSGRIVAAAVAAGVAGMTSWAVLMHAILKPRWAGGLRPQTPAGVVPGPSERSELFSMITDPGGMPPGASVTQAIQ